MKTILEIKNLRFRYNKNSPVILDSINMDIEENSITAIAGLSGCGKSTLAFILCGAIPKSLPGLVEGNILLKNKNIKNLPLSSISKEIGLVFQEVDNQLFLPSVESEIAFAPENYCLPYEEIDNIIDSTLKKLNIEHLRYRNSSFLSGGEKRLIAIASILSLNPDIIILDEVMANLDMENKQLVVNTMKTLQQLGKTIIFIDHDLDNLMMADYIYLMKEGKIEDLLKGGQDNEFIYNKISDFFLSQI